MAWEKLPYADLLDRKNLQGFLEYRKLTDPETVAFGVVWNLDKEVPAPTLETAQDIIKNIAAELDIFHNVCANAWQKSKSITAQLRTDLEEEKKKNYYLSQLVHTLQNNLHGVINDTCPKLSDVCVTLECLTGFFDRLRKLCETSDGALRNMSCTYKDAHGEGSDAFPGFEALNLINSVCKQFGEVVSRMKSYGEGVEKFKISKGPDMEKRVGEEDVVMGIPVSQLPLLSFDIDSTVHDAKTEAAEPSVKSDSEDETEDIIVIDDESRSPVVGQVEASGDVRISKKRKGNGTSNIGTRPEDTGYKLRVRAPSKRPKNSSDSESSASSDGMANRKKTKTLGKVRRNQRSSKRSRRLSFTDSNSDKKQGSGRESSEAEKKPPNVVTSPAVEEGSRRAKSRSKVGTHTLDKVTLPKESPASSQTSSKNDFVLNKSASRQTARTTSKHVVYRSNSTEWMTWGPDDRTCKDCNITCASHHNFRRHKARMHGIGSEEFLNTWKIPTAPPAESKPKVSSLGKNTENKEDKAGNDDDNNTDN